MNVSLLDWCHSWEYGSKSTFSGSYIRRRPVLSVQKLYDSSVPSAWAAQLGLQHRLLKAWAVTLSARLDGGDGDDAVLAVLVLVVHVPARAVQLPERVHRSELGVHRLVHHRGVLDAVVAGHELTDDLESPGGGRRNATQ
eukprot:1083057-Pyramimonas_sp.AAC.3